MSGGTSVAGTLVRGQMSQHPQKGLLKNFQDVISRPLRSREIQEIKVSTVLRGTLYHDNGELFPFFFSEGLGHSYMGLIYRNLQ